MKEQLQQRSIFDNDNSTLIDDRYNIELISDDGGQKILKIQGAELIDPSNDLKYYFDEDCEQVNNVKIKWLRIITPDDDLKLSQIFKTTPYGILKKKQDRCWGNYSGVKITQEQYYCCPN